MTDLSVRSQLCETLLVRNDISLNFLDITSANSYKNATLVQPINVIKLLKTTLVRKFKKSLLGAT